MLRGKRWISYLVISCFIILIAAFTLPLLGNSTVKNDKQITQKVLVELKGDVTNITNLGESQEKLNNQNIYAVNIKTAELKQLRKENNSEIIEPNYETRLLTVNNNTEKEKSINIQQDNSCDCSECSGELTWNIAGIKADILQNKGITGRGVKVAVFDTGIDLHSYDLNVAGGVSFIDGVDSYDDDNGHGTEMAGILAAQLNGRGVVGAAPQVELYSVKVLDKNGTGRYSNIIQGIQWAIDHHMDIITLSLGGTQYSRLLKEAIDKAADNNILVLAAAGNGGDNKVMYPAAYSKVICVGATDRNGKIADFSDYDDQMDILAPGVDIETTGLNNIKKTVDGTSAAVGHVAGVAALLWSADNDLTADQVKSLLLEGTDDIKGNRNYKSVNAEKAYKELLQGNYSYVTSKPEQEDNELTGGNEDGTVTAQTCTHSSMSPIYAVASTCTNQGYVDFRCSICGAIIVKTLPLAPHTYVSTVVPAGCYVQGYTLHTCSVCGTSYKDTYTAAGHDWRNYNYPSNCISQGFSGLMCARCGLMSGTYLAKTAHTPKTVYGTHTSQGDYYTTSCTACGTVLSTGYAYNPNCLSCTTAPSVSFSNITGNTILSETDTNFPIQINVGDQESDTITCNYYLDGSTTSSGTIAVASSKTGVAASFTNTINAANLSEGSHTIKVTAKDPVAPTLGTASVTFKVDKSLPAISSVTSDPSVTGVTITATAQDAVSGLATNAYRYTVGGITTDWLPSNSYNVSDLVSNTNYNYTVEVKDKVGHISSYTGSFSTITEKPSVTVTALSENKLQVLIKDNNPLTTCYRIQTGSSYADANGNLVDSESWINLTYDETLGGKKIILTGLSSNTEITVVVSVKNSTTGGITTCDGVSAVTSPAVPSSFKCTAKTSASITLSWDQMPGADCYELYRETVSSDGTILSTKTFPVTSSLSCTDTDVTAEQTYHYKLRAGNTAGNYGVWTDSLTVTTLPIPPAAASQVAASVQGAQLSITWEPVTGAIGYKIEVACDGTTNDYYSTTNSITVDAKYNCQCSVTVQAFNICDENDKENHEKWINGGPVSDAVICYTQADMPTLNLVDIASVTPNSVELQWSPNGNPDSVQYKLGIFKDNTLINETAYSAVTETTVTGLTPQTTYTFKVKARSSDLVETEWSNEISAITLIDYPGIPVKLRATAKSEKITLAWDAASNAQSYQVERNGSIIAKDLTGTSFVDDNLTPSTEYTYRVCAVNTTGTSDWSQTLVKKTLGAVPAAPEITSVTGSSISATISWSTTDNTTIYEIEVDGQRISAGLDTSYKHEGLLPDSYHTYRVRARNDYGSSDWSELYTFHTTPNIPDVPGDVSIATTDTQISVLWGSVTGADSYDVEIDGTVYSEIAQLQFIYTVPSDVKPESEHIIRVRAVNEGGQGGWSASYVAKLLAEGEGNLPEVPVPATPTLACSVSGSAIISVTWNAVDGATVYQLEDNNTIVYSGPNTSFTQTGIYTGTHLYQVSAGNMSGYSDWSNVVAVTGSAISLSPQNVTYYRESDTSTAVTWDKIDGVTGYQIEVNGVVSENIISDTKTSITTVPGQQYDIRIAAVTQNGENTELNWSEELTFRTSDKLPASPEVESMTAASDSITVTWGAVDKATGYEIYVDGQITDVKDNLTYSVTNLEASSSHTIKLRAYNEAGSGSWSEISTIMTNEGIPGVPINITGESVSVVSSVTGSAISIKWDKLDGADSYEVEDSDGNIHTTDTNSIVIDGLEPGKEYNYRVRAVTTGGAGAWSSKITITPVLTAPVNVGISTADGLIHITWDKVGGADYYEIEIDGIIVATTETTSMDFNYSTFYKSRTIRIRACYGTQKSEWSKEVTFDQTLPVMVDVTQGEEISVILPVKNADISQYKLTLTYDSNELELLDAFEMTLDKEITSAYIEEYNTHIVIENNDGMISITYIIDADEAINWSGIASSISFLSKITGTATLTYSVAAK